MNQNWFTITTEEERTHVENNTHQTFCNNFTSGFIKTKWLSFHTGDEDLRIIGHHWDLFET